MSTKSHKIDFREEFMVMWREEQSLEVEIVPRNFAKLTGKHLCQNLFFNKVAGLAKFLTTPFLTEHLRADCFQSLKRMLNKFQVFSDLHFRIKFCFK